MRIDAETLHKYIAEARQEVGLGEEHQQILFNLAMAESGGVATAKSPKGALGIMQLMPDTAAQLGVDPYDVRQNIRGGVKYYAQLLKQFQDPHLAVAAYNAGPGAVAKYGGIPPYKETHGLVQKVFGELPWNKQIIALGPEAASIQDAIDYHKLQKLETALEVLDARRRLGLTGQKLYEAAVQAAPEAATTELMPEGPPSPPKGAPKPRGPEKEILRIIDEIYDMPHLVGVEDELPLSPMGILLGSLLSLPAGMATATISIPAIVISDLASNILQKKVDPEDRLPLLTALLGVMSDLGTGMAIETVAAKVIPRLTKLGIPRSTATKMVAEIEAKMAASPELQQVQPEQWQRIQHNLEGLLKKAFPTAEVAGLPNIGEAEMARLQTPAGKTILVFRGGVIPESESALAKHGKTSLERGEYVAGASQVLDDQAIMWLAKGEGADVISHETWHLAEQMVLTPDEIARVAQKFGGPEQRAEAYMAWMAGRQATEADVSIFAKIKGFFSDLWDNYFASWRQVFKTVESGTVWERQLPTVGAEPSYAIKKIPELPEIGEGEYQLKIGDTITITMRPSADVERFLSEPLKQELKEAKYVVNINMERLDVPEDIDNMIRKMGEIYAKEYERARRGTMSAEQVRYLAETLGMTPEDLLRRPAGTAYNTEQLTAARTIVLSSYANLKAQTAKAFTTQSPSDWLEMMKHFSLTMALNAQLSGALAEAGRALRFLKEISRAQKYIERTLQEVAQKMNIEKISQLPEVVKQIEEQMNIGKLEEIGRAILMAENSSQIGAIIQKIVKPRWHEYIFNVIINGMLSSPKTQLVNILGNVMATTINLAEHWLANKMGKIFGYQSHITEGEVLAMWHGMLAGWRDALRMARKAWITNEPPTAGVKWEHFQDPFTRHYLRNPDSDFAKAIYYLGQFINLPSKTCLASDEFFKFINYSAYVHGQAYKWAIHAGARTKDEIAQTMAAFLADIPEDIARAGMDFAHYATFTGRVGEITSAMARLKYKLPLLNLVVPFVKTPGAIFRFVMERTPFAPLFREFREAIQAGGVAKELAMARLMWGSMTTALIASLTAAGLITGGGPTKPELREAMRANGWQPYSIKIGDQYIPYGRIDPLGGIIGIAADLAEMIMAMPDLKADEIASLAVVATARTFLHKIYMRNLADLLEAISNPEQMGRRYLQNTVRMFVPYSGLLVGIRQTFDPYARETRAGREADFNWLQSAINEMKSRIPYYSGELPVRRDIWGRPVSFDFFGPDLLSPWVITKDLHDPLTKVIIDNKVTIGMPARSIGGIQLTAEEYDYYAKRSGELARQLVAQMIEHPRFKTFSSGPDGGQAALLRMAFSTARRLAAREMLVKFPQLRHAILQHKEEIWRSTELQEILGGLQ